MPTVRSVQATKVNTTLASTGYTPNPANEQSGKLRVAYFSYAVPNIAGTPGLGATDVLELCLVPAGARILGITVTNSALGGSAAGSIGDAADNDRLVTSVSIASAAQADVAMRVDSTDTDENPALGYGYEYTADTVISLYMTAATANATAGVIRGHIEYTIE